MDAYARIERIRTLIANAEKFNGFTNAELDVIVEDTKVLLVGDVARLIELLVAQTKRIL